MKTAPILVSVVLTVLGSSCSRNDFDDRSAVVDIGGETIEFEVDSCGLDGQTAFLVGRADAGGVLQAVVGVEDDGHTGVPGSTGLTVSEPDTIAAFGVEAWKRRGEYGLAPGAITSARIRGSRIQVTGEIEAVGDDDRPAPGAVVRRFSLDARCDDLEG